MTNEQLAILLQIIQERLKIAIHIAEEKISHTRDKISIRSHKSNVMCSNIFFCQKEDHFTEELVYQDVEELKEIHDIINDLESAILILGVRS